VALEVEYQKPSRFRIRASGEVTLEEIESMYGQILAHPGLVPGADAIVLTGEVADVPSPEELRVAARDLRPILDRGLGAICVVAPNPFLYGVARMFSVFAESFGGIVTAARSEDEASRWLAERREPGPTSN
jgi:hypothetical protein